MSDTSPFAVACARAGNMQTKKLDSYMASTNADGYSLSDLPLKDLGTTRVKAAVDIVKVPRGCVVTQESLLTGLNERNMDALPDIVKPQADCPVPFDFQIVMWLYEYAFRVNVGSSFEDVRRALQVVSPV